MTRPLRIFIELALTATFIVTIALAVLIWRVSTSPLHLEEFVPDIEAALQSAAPDMSFKINTAFLTGGEAEEVFEIVLRDITMRNANNEKVGSVQGMRLGFSWRNLLLFSLTPSKVWIRGTSVQLVRFEDGHIGFNTTAKKDPSPASRSLDQLTQAFARAPDAFKEIRIKDAWVQFEDRKDPFTLEAKNGDFLLVRQDKEIAGSLTLNLESGDFKQKVTGSIAYDAERQQTRLTMGVRDIDMAELSKLLTQLPQDAKLSTPVTAVGEIIIDNELQPLALNLNLSTDKGELTFPPYLPQAVTLDKMFTRVVYNLLDKSLTLERLQLTIGKAVIAAQGYLHEAHNKTVDRNTSLQAQITNLPIDQLDHLWPHELATNARDWVTKNINGGTVGLATLDMKAVLKADGGFHVNAMGGKVAFRDTTVSYLPHMPVVRKVDGVATYDADNFNINTTAGELLDTKVTKGEIAISGLQQHLQRIDMLFDLNGPLQDTMRTIESKPLEYLQKMKMKSDQFAGVIRTKLYLGFPLLHDLKMEQVDMKAAGVITDATIRNVVRDLTATSDRLVLKVDTDALQVSGRARLADANVQVEWREFFNDKHHNGTEVDLSGAITPAVLRDLRIPIENYLKGNGQGTVKVVQDHKKNIAVSVNATADQADIVISELGLSKARGVPAKVALDAAIDADGTTTFSNASLSWPNMSMQGGMARLDRNGNLESATLKNVRMGRTNASFIVTPVSPGRTRLVVSGDTVDLSGYWSQKKEPTPKDAPLPPRYDISLRTSKLYLDPELPFTAVRADISVQGPQILAMDINAAVEDAKLMAVQKPIAGGLQTLDVTANHTGKILQALDMTDALVGGELSIHGRSTTANPDLIEGRMWLKKFKLVKAPVLARLINALSPVGLLELLNDKGLNFDSLISDITLQKRGATIKLTDGKLSGSSLGMTFGGYMYRTSGNISLKGTIVPMEGINKFASRIPLIGQILTGIKGEGILAATYRIKGLASDPTVTVNPLAALAPGILRSILFSGGEEKEE